MLIVGADGLIGGRLAHDLTEAGHTVWRTSRKVVAATQRQIQLDLSALDPFECLPSCHFAFLCAGVTSMALCQQEPSATRMINVINTVKLAQHLLDLGLLHLYTHHTFTACQQGLHGSGNQC